MAASEDEFKQRLVAVLKDLKSDGKQDMEAMWLLGSLGAVLIDKAKQPSWNVLKDALTREAYDGLLRDFQTQGNSLYQQGKRRHAYAVQLLGMSLVGKTQLDQEVQAGVALLDEIIDAAVIAYRKNPHLGTVG